MYIVPQGLSRFLERKRLNILNSAGIRYIRQLQEHEAKLDGKIAFYRQEIEQSLIDAAD